MAVSGRERTTASFRERTLLQSAVVVVLFAALSFTAGTAWAQKADDGSDRDAAVKLADLGFGYLENGEFDRAADHFERAVKLYYTPVIALHWARAEAKRGRLVKAREVVEKIQSQPLPDDAKPSWTRAVEDSLIFAAELDGRIPTVTVTVADGVEAELSVDGRPVKAGKPTRVDPGKHQVKGRTAEGVEKAESFSLQEKATHEVTLVFEGAEGPVIDGALVGPIVAYGVAGVALVVGTVTGVIFVGKANELDEQCPEDVCPVEQAEALDDTKALGNASTVAFVIAGLAAAAGTVLLFVPLGEGEDPVITVRATPTSASLQLRF